jgi:hypothetical protein
MLITALCAVLAVVASTIETELYRWLLAFLFFAVAVPLALVPFKKAQKVC